jgi:hypothetical protein
MSIGISAEAARSAYKDSDKYLILTPGKREFDIHHNDGMTLRITQDGALDYLVNTFDAKRLKLEKQTEILHDYYGDRLLAKELFDRYLSYKRLTGGVASLLTVGLIGANVYTRVLKNSVFMGKVGTLGSILALHYAGRYLSNSYLEKEIELPWKIHTHRMTKGLGPTNFHGNDHSEIITSPLRFFTTPYAAHDFLYGSLRKIVPSNINVKYPVQQEHFPFAPDEEDMNKLQRFEGAKPKRFEKMQPEDDGEAIHLPEWSYRHWYYTNGSMAMDPYLEKNEIFKNFYLRGLQTIYKPESIHKKVAFEPRDLDEDIKGKIVEKNPYSDNPLTGDLDSELPLYAESYQSEVNVTKERVELLSKNYFLFFIFFIL